MAEEIISLERYGNEYGIDIKNEEFNKIIQKVKEIKDLNDMKLEKNKSTLRAIFFITNLEATCKVSTTLNEIQKFFINQDCENPKNNNLNDFICNIKQIHPHLEDLISKETFKIISTLIDEYSFSVRVFYKFEGLFDYFFQIQNNFTFTLKEFMWSLFIQCKSQFLERTRNTLLAIPLLVTVFYMILNDVQEDKLPLSFISEYEKQNLSKSTFLLEFLCSKNFLENKQEIISLKEMIKRDLIIKSNILIKSNESSFSGISINNQEELNLNLSNLKNLYGNSMRIDCFDERLFLINNMKDNSPVKLTPFRKQGHHNYYFKKPNCYQKLDFSTSSTQSPQDMIVDNIHTNTNSVSTSYLNMLNETVKSSLNNHNFNNTFQSMKFSNSAIKNSYSANEFYGLTPCSKIIQMDNWIQKYIKDVSYSNLDQLLPLIGKDIDFLNDYFNEIMEKLDNSITNHKARIKNNRTIMNNLFLKFLNDILWFDIDCFKSEVACNLLLNTDLLTALIVCTVESILFIENVENVSVFKLIEDVKLDLYDFWKIVNPFLKVVSINMPPPLITHFSEIEVQIISLMIWSNKNKFFLEIEHFCDFTNKGENKEIFFIEDEYIETCKKILNNEFSNQTLFVFQNKNLLNHLNPDINNSNPNRSISDYRKFNFLYLFLRRILHYCLIFIKKLQQNLNLQNEVASKIISLIKYIIFEETNLFYSRHIDQILLCSCFLIIKQFRGDLTTFNELLGKRYKIIKQGLSDLEAKSIVSRVLIKNNIYESLIDFYNKTYISLKGIKDFLNDEIRGNKRKKVVDCINYASILLKEDDYISNPGLKIYMHITRIFLGGDLSRSGVMASPDITGTPRTNKIKNTYSEVSFSNIDIQTGTTSRDYFRNKAISTLLSRDTPSKQNGNINEETKNSQSAKSTPEFMKYS